MQENSKKLVSIQPYFVLESQEFKQRIFTKNGISHFFSFSNKSSSDRKMPLIADGCSNIIFEYSNNDFNGYLIGSTLQTSEFMAKKNSDYFGIRLQPSANVRLSDLNLKEIVNKKLNMNESVELKDFMDSMSEKQDFDSRIDLFLDKYLKKDLQSASNQEILFEQISNIIIERKGLIKITELEKLSGYTARYINKIFENKLGMSAKQLCKTVKFQFLINDMNMGAYKTFTSLASEYQFYDQAHFIHEFKEYAGCTPSEYSNKIITSQYNVVNI